MRVHPGLVLLLAGLHLCLVLAVAFGSVPVMDRAVVSDEWGRVSEAMGVVGNFLTSPGRQISRLVQMPGLLFVFLLVNSLLWGFGLERGVALFRHGKRTPAR